MDAEFWRERWRRGQTGWHEGRPNRHLRAHLGRLVEGSAGAVCVPLCGASADLTLLSRHFDRVVGVELVAEAVHRFFEERGLAPRRRVVEGLPVYAAAGVEIINGSIFDVTTAHTGAVDRVFDRAALVALPRELRGRYVGQVLALLPPGGRVLLVSRVRRAAPDDGPPFTVDDAEIETLYGSHCALERLAVEGGPDGGDRVWLATKR